MPSDSRSSAVATAVGIDQVRHGKLLMLREAFKRIGQPEGMTPPTARRALHSRLRW
jgi:hypothetical protein